jgi:hypothetical protein
MDEYTLAYRQPVHTVQQGVIEDGPSPSHLPHGVPGPGEALVALD